MGSVTWPQPNAHGCYEATERLQLAHPAAKWRGCPSAEIRLCHIEAGWLVSVGWQTPTTGGGGPLSPGRREGPWPTRADAIAQGIARLRLCVEGGVAFASRCEDRGTTVAAYRRIGRWLDEIEASIEAPGLFDGLAA